MAIEQKIIHTKNQSFIRKNTSNLLKEEGASALMIIPEKSHLIQNQILQEKKV